jgi:subtilase family serine protease
MSKSEEITGIVILCVLLLVPIAGASYSFDGVPYTNKLDLVAHGTLKGGVYTGESQKLDFPPCTRTFNVPGNVKWARLYLGVWGGTERYEGWVHTTFNGHEFGKTYLRGENDDNPNVYCTGHGVYWVYYDVTAEALSGLNTAIANTSRGERGNKLDGRVYSIILAAVYEDANAPYITYWVADGNVNLHGLGWAGALPAINNIASVAFKGVIDPANVANADLTVLYLAGNSGEPDYLEFNGHDVGGNDVANCGDGETYGIDLKTFDVTGYTQTENSVLFIRGKDINGDGKIDTDDEGNQEGEHYLHPVLTALVAEHKSAEKTLPDFSVTLEFDTLIEGENALTTTVNNYGRLYEDYLLLKVFVDGSEIYSEDVGMDAGGMNKLAVFWDATHGTHTIKAEIDAEDAVQESNEDNNVFSIDADVMSRIDLSVKILTPVPEKDASNAKSSSMLLGLGYILIIPLLMPRNGRSKKLPLLILAILSAAFILSGCMDTQTGDTTGGDMVCYLVPVEIRNDGEAAAMEFMLSLYVDGERSVTKTIAKLDGGETIVEELPITVTKGEHLLRAVVDKKGVVKEFRRDNNEDEITYDF